MIEILREVDGLAVGPVSDGTDKQNKILCEELPFKVLEYKSGITHNGWTVPQKWEVKKAEIIKDGRLIYDGTKHPLGVIGYSESFRGKINLEELKKHLFYKKDAPNNIVYHCDLYYKPHVKLWGFSVPYNFYQSLEEGEYEINLETVHENGTMKVLEYSHAGSSEETIILNSHNCHAAQLNDGPSGYAVGIEVMRRLSQRGNKTRYSYKLVIAPEHLGTVFYTANLDAKILEKYKYCIFLEMLGNDYKNFALQETFNGDTELDKAASHYLKFKNPGFYQGKFRQVVGNDETVWEAPGIEVPTISLSRCQSPEFYYAEYHLDSDNISIMSENRIEESADVLLGTIDILETNYLIKRKFNGLIALSNSAYNLYIGIDDPSIDIKVPEIQKKWNNLMNCLPRYFDEKTHILDIAIKHGLPYDELNKYLLRFREKELIEFI